MFSSSRPTDYHYLASVAALRHYHSPTCPVSIPTFILSPFYDLVHPGPHVLITNIAHAHENPCYSSLCIHKNQHVSSYSELRCLILSALHTLPFCTKYCVSKRSFLHLHSNSFSMGMHDPHSGFYSGMSWHFFSKLQFHRIDFLVFFISYFPHQSVLDHSPWL